MKALVTSLHFAGLTGSEVVALEIIEGLKRMGVDVSVYSYAYSEGYVQYFRHCGVALLEDAPCLWDYDLVWSHHGLWCRLLAELPLPENSDALLPLIAPVSLSPYEEVERIPIAPAQRLGLTCWANSEETADVERARLGNACPVRVFSNAAPLSFHRPHGAWAADQGAACSASGVRRILVVSNHPPQELLEAVEWLSRSGEAARHPRLLVDLAGDMGVYRRMRPDILRGYDAVVTIGKTVQYCICLGVPVYVYDQHGGPGWLLADVYEKARYYNFSGRPWPTKSPEQIASELCHLPSESDVVSRARLAQDARDLFCLDAHLEDLLSQACDRDQRLSAQNRFVQSWMDGPDFVSMLAEIGRLHAYIQRLQPLAIRDLATSSARRLVTAMDDLRAS